MKPYLLILPLLAINLPTVHADERRDALRSIEDAVAAVDDDRGRNCRQVARRDLQDAGDEVRKASKRAQLDKVASWLATLATDARDVCETSTVRSIRRAQRDVEDYALVVEKAAKDETKTGPIAMSPAEFAQLVKAVKNASFSDDKIAVITGALAHHFVDVSQLGQLVKLISFDDDRLTLVSRVWMAVVDRKKNGYKIAEAFSFPDSGQKAVAILTQ